jgi:hypothetical protein
MKKNPENLCMTLAETAQFSKTDGDGINQFMHLLREMSLEDSTRLPNYDLLNASRFSHSKNRKAEIEKRQLERQLRR